MYPHLMAANADSAENKSWWRQTILLCAAQTNPAQIIQEAIRQGATELAYACYRETQYTLDEEFEAEMQALKPAVRASRYAKLEEYLKAQQWKEADKETYRLIITAVGKEEGQWFIEEELLNFPCDELKAIDRLWVQHSNGHFGLSVQKQIYVKCGGNLDGNYLGSKIWDAFGDRVGWRNNGEWMNYSDLNPSLSSPQEIFPVLCSFLGVWVGGGFSSLARRLVNCSI